jgi:hypothetical protein
MQRVALGQDIPPSEANVVPLGSGIETIDQREPFQDSANVSVTCSLVVYEPTAMQRETPLHEIALSELDIAPRGTGFWISERVLPFHRSVSMLLPDTVGL